MYIFTRQYNYQKPKKKVLQQQARYYQHLFKSDINVEIVLEGFLICTQNAGFISEWISPQKTLFQPTSSYVYLLLGQVLPDRLLEDHYTKPITVQEDPVVLSQYADDTDIYMMYDQYIGNFINSL